MRHNMLNVQTTGYLNSIVSTIVINKNDLINNIRRYLLYCLLQSERRIVSRQNNNYFFVVIHYGKNKSNVELFIKQKYIYNMTASKTTIDPLGKPIVTASPASR